MSDMFFKVCSHWVFGLKEHFVHPQLDRCWEEAIGCEKCTRDEVERLVARKLEKVLRHAAETVPYYRKWFAEKNLSKKTLQIGDFPIIEKKDIRGHEDEFVSATFMKKRMNWTRTSGSTGEPFKFGRSKDGWDYTYATLWRGLYRFDIHPGDKRVLVKGVDERPQVSFFAKVKRWLYEWINRCIVVDAHFLAKSDANVLSELRRIEAYKPKYVHGYVSSIYLLAQYADRHDIDLAVLRVKAIVTESEKCQDFQRELMERVFAAPVVENYGCVEFGMISQPAKDGKLCINEDHVYVETTDAGEVVLTNLDEYGFPLIRFKNGDRLTLGPVHSTLPYRTIQSIDGRIAEMICLPQGGALQGYIVMYPISKHMQHLKQYQVYQPDIDHLVIRVVPVAAALPKDIGDQIIREMREIVGNKILLSIDNVETIPLTKRGKRAFVVSEVRK